MHRSLSLDAARENALQEHAQCLLIWKGDIGMICLKLYFQKKI